MPSGLIALLDDVATIAKLAAASLDDVGAAAGKAGTKSAALLIDDTAVTPRYVVGLAPERELPIIAKITVGSLKNKLLFLFPAALLLSAFAPFLIVPLLMIGGSYLCFEGMEKIVETARGEVHHSPAQIIAAASSPGELEKMQVNGAIRTDLILSAEIMAIALAELEASTFGIRAVALVAVAIVVTLGVYGAVALIVKLDDIGLHLVKRKSAAARALGNGLVRVVPSVLSALTAIGTGAMLWVGGGIIVHGLEELHIVLTLPRTIHDLSVAAGDGAGPLGPAAEWLVYALGSAIAGSAVGGIIVAIVRQFTSHPEDLVDL